MSRRGTLTSFTSTGMCQSGKFRGAGALHVGSFVEPMSLSKQILLVILRSWNWRVYVACQLTASPKRLQVTGVPPHAWLLTGSVPENGVVLVVISQDPAKSASRRLRARLLPTGLRSSTRSTARFRDRFLPKRQDHPSQSPPRLLSFGSSKAMGWLRGVLSRGASPLPLVPLSKCIGLIWRSAVGGGDSHEKNCAPRTRTTGPGASHRTGPIRVARIRRNSCPRILRTDSSG